MLILFLVILFLENKEIVSEENYVVAPLWFEGVAPFGYLLFKAKLNEDIEKLNKSVIAFSYYLYNDALGSIVKSFHNTILKVEDLSVDYKTGKTLNRVVKHVNFEICIKQFSCDIFIVHFKTSVKWKSYIT